MTIEINVIDHRPTDHQPVGEIIRPLLLAAEERDGPYADFCALQNMWSRSEPPDIIGFFGYRKYLAPRDNMQDFGYFWPAHAPNWYQCSEPTFNDYRAYLLDHDGADIKALLAQYDILQAAPFPLQEGIFLDFMRSRSIRDGELLLDVLPKSWTSMQVYPYLFITRWSVFNRMMREIEPVRRQLHGKCTGADSTNEEYKKRPMAYVMERVYSLWLENSGLSIKEMPLLHCWEKR